jgi:hypothetical protein
VKTEVATMVMVMVFWGLSFAGLGWLVFKIAERM